MAIPKETLDKLRRNDPTVVGLDLTLQVESDNDIVLLVDALKNNTYLTTLTIQGIYSKKGIGDESAQLLSTCKNLIFLDLSWNQHITNIGASAFVAHPTLETLFFRGCGVTPAGLIPFLKNNILHDLRIATSAAPAEAEGEAIKEKLEENAKRKKDLKQQREDPLKILSQKLESLPVASLSYEFSQFIQQNADAVEQLPKALQIIARTNPHEWDGTVVTGLTLARHLTKVKSPTVVAHAAVFMRFYKEYHEYSQASPSKKKAKTSKEEETPSQDARSPSLSPSI